MCVCVCVHVCGVWCVCACVCVCVCVCVCAERIIIFSYWSDKCQAIKKVDRPWSDIVRT